MSFTLPSFAKINLRLEVLGKRDDGFHEIFTILQTVSLYDELTFELTNDAILLTCDDPAIPVDDRNLIVKAADLLRSRYDSDRGVRIVLQKRIASGGGLGGGSSNAATALIGLSRLWGLNAPLAEIEQIAITIGSDVPFFLHGGTAAGFGLGSDIEEMDDFDAKFMVIVSPGVSVSTAGAYERLNARSLTNTASNRILNVSRAVNLLGGELKNDFETTVFATFPEIRRAKIKLIDLGARNALLSGSGASVFGIFDNEETRQTALKALGQEANWRSFAVAAVSRSEYREKLGIGN